MVGLTVFNVSPSNLSLVSKVDSNELSLGRKEGGGEEREEEEERGKNGGERGE